MEIVSVDVDEDEDEDDDNCVEAEVAEEVDVGALVEGRKDGRGSHSPVVNMNGRDEVVDDIRLGTCPFERDTTRRGPVELEAQSGDLGPSLV